MNKERILEKTLQDSKDAPTTKQAYGEHLYAQIKELYPAYAQQLTGVLMEADVSTLLLLLRDEDLLMKRIDSALDILFGKSDEIQRQINENKEELGDILYEKVAEIETESCAQITGMLLDLDRESLQSLLDDPDELEVAVYQAKASYLQHLPPPAEGPPSAEASQDDHPPSDAKKADTESLSQPTQPPSPHSEHTEPPLGDRVYEAVLNYCPQHVAKITGMLVELGPDRLAQILSSPDSIRQSVLKAQEALEKDL